MHDVFPAELESDQLTRLYRRQGEDLLGWLGGVEVHIWAGQTRH